MKYLYGAAVQGIQGFIFQTSKLSEIVGASELVEKICTEFFENEVENFKEENLILAAAGNIKYIFEDAASCQKIVRQFPKCVMEKAPGITISQAVVKMEDGKDIINELERKLKVQRNKPITITDGVGLMVTETARKTGGIGFEFENDDGKTNVIDKAQYLKRKESEKANKKLLKNLTGESKEFASKFPFNIEEIVKGDKNKSWIAVIHADGNNLGQKIVDMAMDLKEQKGMETFRNFSKLLNDTTIEACRNAFNSVITKEVIDNTKSKKIPFRPVILGGDDLTAIIRGDLALEYTNEYLKEFERLSKKNFEDFGKDKGLTTNPFENGLTACAGIAYIKASYPFHYGVSLADKLCQQAKKVSKDIKIIHSPSSLMFHKVHASFVEDYDDIIQAELKAADGIYFNYGPYFIHTQKNFSTVEELNKRVKALNRKDAPKAGLRNWLAELRESPEVAAQTLERIATLNKKYNRELCLTDPYTIREIKEKEKAIKGKFTPIFDAMSLSNI